MLPCAQVLDDAAQHEARTVEQATLRERVRIISQLSNAGVAPGVLLPLLQPSAPVAPMPQLPTAGLLSLAMGLGVGQPLASGSPAAAPAPAAPATAPAGPSRLSESWQLPAVDLLSLSSPPSLSALNHFAPAAAAAGGRPGAKTCSSAHATGQPQLQLPNLPSLPSLASDAAAAALAGSKPTGGLRSARSSCSSLGCAEACLDPVTAAPYSKPASSLLTAGFREQAPPRPIGRHSDDQSTPHAGRRNDDSLFLPYPATFSAGPTPTAAEASSKAGSSAFDAAAGLLDECSAAQAALCSDAPVLASMHVLGLEEGLELGAGQSGPGSSGLARLGADLADPLRLRSEFLDGRSAFVAPARSASLLAACNVVGAGAPGDVLAGWADLLPVEL